MKCPKRNKYCKPVLCVKAKSKDYVCSGISHKPTKYPEDLVWLCLSGALIKETKLEMTKDEALIILAALSLAASDDRLKS